MAARVTILCALIVYLLSLAGAASAPRPTTAAPVPAAPPTPTPTDVHRALPQPVIGFSIALHHTEKIHLYRESIDQLVSLGVNSLQIVTPAFQADGADETIRLTPGPGRGPTREQLVGLLHYAHQRGLRTALMPVVLFTTPRGNEWRGKISPNDWNKWWTSYQSIMDYFTSVAVETDVDVLAVGSELLSTESQTDRWLSMIDRTRARYTGKLLYSTNWDHYHVPPFWGKLDYIGISGYWDLTRNAKSDPASDEDLGRRFTEIQESIFAFARAQNKPIIITEVGYPTLSWALKDPWNYVADSDEAPVSSTQARGYQAFIKTFDRSLYSRGSDPLAGVFFYAWDPYRSGDAHDTGYGIRGKPAEQIVRDWLKNHRH